VSRISRDHTVELANGLPNNPPIKAPPVAAHHNSRRSSLGRPAESRHCARPWRAVLGRGPAGRPTRPGPAPAAGGALDGGGKSRSTTAPARPVRWISSWVGPQLVWPTGRITPKGMAILNLDQVQEAGIFPAVWLSGSGRPARWPHRARLSEPGHPCPFTG
jgi:hypothetical protein